VPQTALDGRNTMEISLPRPVRAPGPKFPALALAALAAAAGAAPAQVVYTKIADTATGPFVSFGTPFSQNSQAPSLAGSVVAFNGGGVIYTAPAGGGGPPVASPVQLPTGQFVQALTQPATNGSRVAFVGANGSTGRTGVYSGPVGGGGSLAVVADPDTPVPNGSGNFQSFFQVAPSLSGSVVAFNGILNSTSPPTFGLYTGPAAGGGPLGRVADPTTAVTPNTVSPSVSGTVVAFNGTPSGGGSGIYTAPAAGGSFTPVASTASPIPNGSGTFTGFGLTPAVSGSVVAFVGSGSGQVGVYTRPVGGGALTRVADTSTAIPGGSGRFTNFPDIVDVSGSAVAFVGTGGGGQSGLYYAATAGGPLTKLLAIGDAFDGRTVSTLSFNDGLEGSDVAFTAAFTNGSQAIYVAHVSQVPEPSSLLLVAAGSLTVLAARRRRAASSGRPASD